MGKSVGKQLLALGWNPGPAVGLAIRGVEAVAVAGDGLEAALTQAQAVAEAPEGFVEHPAWGEAARALIIERGRKVVAVRETPVPFEVCGAEGIEPGAVEQMRLSCMLPVSRAGFLAPDAHVGYGLPIGGVLATVGAIIPWAVGVDIGCRMKMTITDLPPDRIAGMRDRLAKVLEAETRFGMGAAFEGRDMRDHDVMDDPAWGTIAPRFRQLKDKAHSQLGSSGGGNHFVEWGEVHLTEEVLGVPPGSYVALLSHSGSRGFGSKVADYYSGLAETLRKGLPKQYTRLAWLEMDSGEGQEYWEAMNLAGRFSAANHDCIHRHVVRAAGLKALAQVENHHNFAWIEEHGGERLMVHRKGATPAGRGVHGIIPGSMGDPGYLVEGLGNEASLGSASHGAGRAMSRSKAKANYTTTQLNKYLNERGVTLLSGGLDECPMAYKDIRAVMARQSHLVRTLGEFRPRIVKMAEDEGRPSWES